ncbi:Dynein heavy chain 7, axonemal, partial [Tetrabaena socialis]
ARRYYYVTPTSYLELLLSFKSLLAKRQNEVMTVKRRYEIGLEKLQDTEESVVGMKEELIALQPQLEESTRQTEAAMEVISKESVEADKVKQVVSKEEATASAEAATVKAIKDECEADLAEAMPLLEGAIAALNTLKPADITEVKGMKSPPKGVKRVMEAICIMKGVKPSRVKDTNTGRMVEDYWEASKKMLMEFDFLESLRKYDKDHIPAEVVMRIRPYVQDPEFQPDIIEKQSLACAGLCKWVVAIEKYDKVIKEVEPKRQKLREAEAQLEERRKFGPIGWNIPYEFNENDLRISVRQLRMFLDEYPDIPYDTLAYTAGECNYGGKVTDSHDRHTLMTVLSTYYTPRIHEAGYKLSVSGTYFPQPYTSYKGYVEYINSLPLIAQPEVFGLHENADITKDLQETNLLLDSLMLTQSREASGGAASFESVVGEVAAEVLERLPPNFDIEAVERVYPQDYYNSINTVLAQ